MKEPLWRRVMRLHGPDAQADVREEFAFHLDTRIESFMSAGMSEAAARDAALRQFGDLERAAAECTDIGRRRERGVRWRERWSSVARDVGYAMRAMRRSPAFTAATVATIALGIGANTVVFSILNALLLQPIDAARPDELVRIYTSEGHGIRHQQDLLGASSYADFVEFQRSPAFSGIAAYMPLGATMMVNGAPVRVEGRAVSENYFTVLGRLPFIGGAIGERDVVVSHTFWRSVLGADSAAIGRTFLLNGQHLVVLAGITSPDFQGVEMSDVQLYVSFAAARDVAGRSGLLTDRGERSVRLLGRLAADATPGVAEKSLDAMMHALGRDHPRTNANRRVSVRPARSIVPMELFGHAVMPVAALVFVATLVMLAVSGVNVAAVLLARTIRRRRELAVRVSLGASRGRIVRQLVTENTALALIAGLLVIGLLSMLPVAAATLGVPASVRPDLDERVLGYALATALGFGLLFGFAPALLGMRQNVVESLRDGTIGAASRARAQWLLVCSQIALSMVLLVVSTALLGSLERQQRVDPGFAVDGLVIAQFEDPLQGNGERDRRFFEIAYERLTAIPGVTSMSWGSMAPLTSDGMRSTTSIPGYTPAAGEDMEIPKIVTGAAYFRTLGIPVLRGRERSLDDLDSLPRVVVNETMAKRYWLASGRDPVGSFVRLGGPGGTAAEVIGVVADARFRSLAEAPQPMYAVQLRAGMGGYGTVLIRTSQDAAVLMLAVRGSMSRNDVPFTLVHLRTMENVLRSSLGVSRAVSRALLVLGILAIALASMGLYGVVSYATAGRAREFGVRLALGATPASITRLVLGYGARLALIGGGAGLLLGLVVLYVIENMLFGSWASAPLGVVVAFVLGAVTLAACAIPAARATAVSPSSALRAE